MAYPRLKQLVQLHPLPAWLYDDDTLQFLDVNDAMAALCGYPRDELLMKKITDVCVDTAAGRPAARETLSGSVPPPTWWRVRPKRGKTIDVRSTSRRVRVRRRGAVLVLAEQIARSGGATVDITNRKRAEATPVQWTAERQAFYDLSRQLRKAPGVDEMYSLIVEHARSALGAYHGCLALLNPERHVFTRVYTVGIVTEKIGSIFPAAGTRSGRVASDGMPFVSADFSRERVPDWMDFSPYRNLGALAVVPVRSDEGVIGTLCAARTKGPGRPAFTDSELRLFEGIAEVAGIAIQRARLHRHLQDAYVQLVLALGQAMAMRDARTARHCDRAVMLAERIAHELGCSEREVQDIRWGAQLHDIGKIGLPDVVLRKPTALTEEEWTAMRQHPILGEEILGSVERMRGAAKLVRHHQEAWDGTGYPDGLKGEAIPLGARILAVADTYVAITETRPYKPARSHAEAVAVIQRCAGTQFDPRVVEVFSAVVERLENDTPCAPQATSDHEGPGQETT